ncbi:MAG: MarR family transcriptional regulator [Nitriliruptorales bacterium]|nr:MarR family transcriptional regulator [Nitriliruptorales bacterium]
MSTLNQNGPPSGLARELVAAFGAFGPAYMKWLHAQARDGGVTYARMRTLHVLYGKGSQIMSGLRDHLGVTARSVTALVDALEAEALVRRVPHPSDRRATIVELTDQGRAAIDGQFEAHAQRAAALFSRIPREDQRALLRIMRALGNELRSLIGDACPVGAFGPGGPFGPGGSGAGEPSARGSSAE